jgi:hypothetical protein
MIMQKDAARRTRAAEPKGGFYPAAATVRAVSKIDTG